MDKNAKIYIAWHTGLVWWSLLKRLVANWYANIIIKTRNELDLLDQKSVSAFFEQEKPEYVFLCAARVWNIEENKKYPADFFYENVLIQNNVIRSSHMHWVKKLLFVASSTVYPSSDVSLLQEDMFGIAQYSWPNASYALAKYTGINLCQKISEQYHKTFISCVPTNIYWPWDHFGEQKAHVIAWLIQRIHDAKIHWDRDVIIRWSGKPIRDFIYTDDVADAMIFLMENYSDSNIVNIWTSEEISILWLAELIKEIVGYAWSLSCDTTKPDWPARRVLDTSKINQLWRKHSINIKEWLKKTYEYFLSILS